MEGYSAKIVNTSKELSAREKIKIKDLTNAVGLDEAVTDDVPLMVTPSLWAELAIHNEKSKDKDYKKYILIDAAGTKYATGSESFWSAFNDIVAELEDAGEEGDFTIEIYRLPSKNYSGKSFLTCSLQ